MCSLVRSKWRIRGHIAKVDFIRCWQVNKFIIHLLMPSTPRILFEFAIFVSFDPLSISLSWHDASVYFLRKKKEKKTESTAGQIGRVSGRRREVQRERGRQTEREGETRRVRGAERDDWLVLVIFFSLNNKQAFVCLFCIGFGYFQLRITSTGKYLLFLENI